MSIHRLGHAMRRAVPKILLPSPLNYDTAMLADGPLFYWKFDEASGSLINYGTAGGTVAWGTASRRTRSVGGFSPVAGFSNSRFVVGGRSNSSWTLGHSIEAVVIIDDTGSNTILGERITASSDPLAFYLGMGRYSGRWSTAVSANNSTVQRADSLVNAATGVVVHLVGVHDYVAQELRLYRNGVREATTTGVPKRTDGDEFYIGGSPGTGAAEYSGAMGRVALFDNKVLTDAQVAAHYAVAPMV